MSRRHTSFSTALGEMTAVADGDRLAGLYFPGHRYLPGEESFGERVEVDGDALFERTRSELEQYLSGERTVFDVAVITDGDTFSEQVWAMLTQIPFGTTTTYGALAQRLGDVRLAQRVGRAVGRNPISIVIPCHRVVGADGSLTGYAGGLDRKRRLLELEEPAEVATSRLF